jgi:hypothetical protein
MNTWAVLAAKQAVLASGFGAGAGPVIGTGPLDGFAIGVLASGACFLACTAPRRMRRRAAVAGNGLAGHGVVGASVVGCGVAEPRVVETSAGRSGGPNSSGGPNIGDGAAMAASATMPRPPAKRVPMPRRPADAYAADWERLARTGEIRAVPAAAGRDAVAPDGAAPAVVASAAHAAPAADGHRKGARHRLVGAGAPSPQLPAPPRRGMTRRAAPRHAAPPAHFGGKVISRIAARPVAGGAGG